jgi:hypothetical protein
LDKRWIFGFRPVNLTDDARRFLLYTGTGIATTGLFWAIELAAMAILSAPWARYAGGAVGLGAGYASKYALDRAFVFSSARRDTRSPDASAIGVSGHRSRTR